MLIVLPVPAFKDNYIWLIRRPEGTAAAVVDPGDADPVLDALEEQGLTLVAVLITHHHGDHVGGARRLLARYDVPVYGPAREHIPAVTHPQAEGARVVLSDLDAEFRVLDVPGHTTGHLAYYGHGLLFCGDTLFTCGCGRLFEGTPEQMHASLEKIRSLPDETLVYCAHEYTLENLRFARLVEPGNTDLAAREEEARRLRAQDKPTVPAPLSLEKAANPFLRWDAPHVIEAAERFAGRPLRSGVEVFATVRYWKDALDG